MRKIILNSKRGDDICPECYNLGTLRGINTSRKGIDLMAIDNGIEKCVNRITYFNYIKKDKKEM